MIQERHGLFFFFFKKSWSLRQQTSHQNVIIFLRWKFLPISLLIVICPAKRVTKPY